MCLCCNALVASMTPVYLFSFHHLQLCDLLVTMLSRTSLSSLTMTIKLLHFFILKVKNPSTQKHDSLTTTHERISRQPARAR